MIEDSDSNIFLIITQILKFIKTNRLKIIDPFYEKLYKFFCDYYVVSLILTTCSRVRIACNIIFASFNKFSYVDVILE